jgi:hypothetical protein
LSYTLASQPVIAVPASVIIAAGSASAGAISAGASGTLLGLFFMSTTKTKLAIAGLLAAASIGGFAASKRQARSQLEEATAHLASQAGTMAVLKEENRSLHEQLNARNLPPPVVETRSASERKVMSDLSGRSELTVIDSLRVLADLQQRKLVRPALTIFDLKGSLDESFVSLFGLTPVEQKRLQQSIDEVREKLTALERLNATVSRDDRGDITVAIQPFPIEGAGLYDEMMHTFADVLGPERNDAFLKIGAEHVEVSLGRFGTAERNYTFSYDPTEPSGQPYFLLDKVIQKNSKGRISGHTDTTRFQSFEDLAVRVGPIVSLLPADYKRPK